MASILRSIRSEVKNRDVEIQKVFSPNIKIHPFPAAVRVSRKVFFCLKGRKIEHGLPAAEEK
jgi:hypothetical protein